MTTRVIAICVVAICCGTGQAGAQDVFGVRGGARGAGVPPQGGGVFVNPGGPLREPQGDAIFITQDFPGGSQGNVIVNRRGDGADVGLIAVEPFESGRPVTGAPYQAEAITEVTQALADGNRIEHRSSAFVARDARGRVRREEQSLAIGGLVAQAPAPIVTISDPTTGSHVTLDPERKSAFRMQTFTMAADAPPGRTREAGAQIGPMTMPLPSEPPGGPGPRVTIMSPETTQTEVRTEQLGTRTVEGVRAEGIRTTMTIPAGSIGNQLPIEVVSERWYSPELQVVVLTKRSDPRFGETTYRLSNIVRVEPPADLFEVPADFRVMDNRLPPSPGVEIRRNVPGPKPR